MKVTVFAQNPFPAIARVVFASSCVCNLNPDCFKVVANYDLPGDISMITHSNCQIVTNYPGLTATRQRAMQFQVSRNVEVQLARKQMPFHSRACWSQTSAAWLFKNVTLFRFIPVSRVELGEQVNLASLEVDF